MASEPPTKILERFYTDYVGPLVRSKRGNKYVLVCVDAFTKFVWLNATRDSTADTTIRELKKIFLSFGFPFSLASDNGPQFTSIAFKNFCFSSGVKHIKLSPYHPQGNMAERVNRNIKSALIAFHAESHNTWDDNLGWLQFAFNISRHEAHRKSPFELMFPFRPRHPLTLLWSIEELLPDNPEEVKSRWKDAKKQLFSSHRKTEIKFNEHRIDSKFAVNQLVLVKVWSKSDKVKKIMSKLNYRWHGPWRIGKFLTPVTVSLVDPENAQFERIAHITHLKPYKCKVS